MHSIINDATLYDSSCFKGHIYNFEEYKRKTITMAQDISKMETTVKLYTKEMFLIAAEKCEVSMIDAQHIMKYIDEYVTPIELPSDEEIENKSKHWGYAWEIYYNGAKWMRDKIINQNK